MNDAFGRKSRPAIARRETSIPPKSEAGRRANARLRPSCCSRIQVEFVSRQAFQYRWNRSSATGRDVMLRQVSVPVPVMACADASSEAWS